jgi:cell division control protein 6
MADAPREFRTDSEIINDDDVLSGDVHDPSGMPERRDELNQIHSAIEPAVRNSNPKNLFLYGKPGQGKTAGVKVKTQQFEDFADREGYTVTITYIECSTNSSSYHVLTTALQKLKDLDEKPKGLTVDQLYTDLFRYMNEHGGTFIYILDEIDKIQDDGEDELNILYKLPRAHSSEALDDDVRCSVIGISNDRRFKVNLSSAIKDALYENEVDFTPYNKEQLKSILRRRAANGLKDTEVTETQDGLATAIESTVITEKAIENCAQHSIRERGSARQAIDILGQAATFAHENHDPKLTSKHLELAEKQVNKNYIKQMLEDHTQGGSAVSEDLLVLSAVLSLEQRGATPATAAEIHEVYKEYCQRFDRDPLVQRRMRDRLQDLYTTGIVSFDAAGDGSIGRPKHTTDLKIPVEETISILNEEPEFAEFAVLVDHPRSA